MHWNDVENSIQKEIVFLKNNLSLSPYTQNDPIKCNDCIYRNIAILIVSGKLKVLKVNVDIGTLWSVSFTTSRERKIHGSDWHDGSIKKIYSYFKGKRFKCVIEPNLIYGRADIGVPSQKLYFEIGTINLYKLYINLLRMEGREIVLVPYDSYFIKFSA